MPRGIFISVFALLGSSLFLSAQNLQIVLDSTFTNLKIGQTFAVTGRVQNTGPDIPSGQTIRAVVEFVAPDGIVVASHEQFWNGFPEGGNRPDLRNDGSNPGRVLFQFPWNQAGKAVAGWTIRAFVEGAALETDLSDNSATHQFSMDLPDLVVASMSLSTDNPGNLFLPDSVITASGVVQNVGQARTQEGVLFPLVARLYRGTDPTIANLVESETLVIPSPNAGGFPYMEENAQLPFSIGNIHLPTGAAPGDDFTLTVTVDPTDLTFGDIVHEVDENGGGQERNASFQISSAATSLARLTVDPDSFEGDVGTFRGLDPARIAFTVRNDGLSPVQPSDAFSVRVALSKDLTFDGLDFVLREFDLGGSALGANLLPDESITLDWVQQLPDNFEGDFYYLVNVQGTANQTFFLENTPSITLESANGGTTELIGGNGNNHMERPDVSRDGKVVVFEQTDGNGIQQVYYQRVGGGQAPTLVSRSTDQTQAPGNAHSLRPKVSADGSVIVFYSKASNLVNFPNDENGVEDVFIYEVQSSSLTRLVNPLNLEEGNAPSLYPDLNEDGSVLVFESTATNLSSSDLPAGRRIFIYQAKSGAAATSLEPIHASADGPSYSPSISDDGTRVVFSSEATNLIAGDTNQLRDVFLHDRDDDETFRANLNIYVQQATGGPSDQAIISGDGSTIVYRSRATNLVEKKGISLVEVINGGVGYFGQPTIVVVDRNATGSGAILEFADGAIDQYGQILPQSVEILTHGENYTNPLVSVIPDPNQPAPIELAEISARLSHPLGEIYSISAADVMNESPSGQRKYSVRISENLNEVGGDAESREPSVSVNGKVIVFSSKSSNFLKESIRRDDGEVFYNYPVRPAEARAVLTGGIGEIEVQNPGSGYQNGFLFINDVSGTGSGAVASYQVDALGRIASITMIDPGADYDLETTFVSVDNPRGGTGFRASATRYAEGGRVQRIEMVDNGSGYQNTATTNQGKAGLISMDGDGADLNGDGKPDAKVNPDRIYVSEDGGGGIFIEQIIDLEFLSANSLLNTTLSFSDYQQTVTLNFAQASTSTSTIGIFGKTLSEITEDIIDELDNAWGGPSEDDRFEGPRISGFSTGGTSFTFAALGGRVESNNPTSVDLSYQSNMLIGGSGFSRATPSIAPAPVIHGYSEVFSSTNADNLSNGRSLYSPVVDTDTDDVYLYELDSGALERVSRSTFGLPVNYLPTALAAMPSNRFPSISGDGRHLFFSSDASGMGGLAFTQSNQLPAGGNNNFRKLYYRDRKTAPEVKNSTPSPVLGITTLTFSPSSSATSHTTPLFPLADGQELTLPLDASGSYVLFMDNAGLVLSDGSNSVQVSDGSGNPLAGWSFSGTGDGSLLDSITVSYEGEEEEEIYEIDLLFPTDDLSFSFGPKVLLPVIADFEEVKESSGINLQVFINDEFAFDLEEFTTDLNYASGRFTANGNVPDESGDHIIQIKAFRGNIEVANSKAIKFSVSPFVGSYAPVVYWPLNQNAPNQLIFQHITSSSSFPLTIFGRDVDGKFESLQFYVDGRPEGSELFRGEGISQDNLFYNKFLDDTDIGLRSIFAVGRDNSGNYSPSPIRNLSITLGTPLDFSAELSLQGPIEQTLTDRDPAFNPASALNMEINATTGEIISVDFNISREFSSPVDFLDHLGDVRVSVLGDGKDAVIHAILDESGKVSSLELEDGGAGYKQATTSLSFVPVVSLMGDGKRAELFIKENFNAPEDLAFKIGLDGLALTGRGYTIAPEMKIIRPNPPGIFQIQGFERLRLIDNGLGMSSLDPTGFPLIAPALLNENNDTLGGDLGAFDVITLGDGFTQSPIYYSFESNIPDDFIEQAKLIVDGEEVDSVDQAPFSFEWTPQSKKDYSVYIAVRDIYGNLHTTKPGSVEIASFVGGGVDADFLGDSNYTVESNAMIMVSVLATSEFEIDHVQFYLDKTPIDKVFRNGSSKTFTTKIDVQALGLTQGFHDLSMVARDLRGNQAGSFSRDETNLSARQSLALFVVPPEIFGSPIVNLLYPTPSLSITSNSSILLASSASDPDNAVTGLQFYVNGDPYGEELLPKKSLGLQNQPFTVPWSPLGQIGRFYFTARATDVMGNESFSAPVIVQVSPGSDLEFVPQVTLGNLSPSYDVGDTIILSATASDESDDLTSQGSIQSVTFFINGVTTEVIGANPDTQAPYVTRWMPQSPGLYKVHAQVMDNEGNVAISEVEEVRVLDVADLNIYLAPLATTTINGVTGLVDGSKASVIASATGKPDSLSNLTDLSLYANGKLVGVDSGEALVLETGLIDRILYNFDWLVDYERYASSNGEVTLVLSGGNPPFSSNTETYAIIYPEIGGPGSVLKDLTGEGIDEQEIAVYEDILEEKGGDAMAAMKEWLSGFKSASIDQRIDIVAAQRITLGRWPLSFTDLLEAENFVTPNNDQWLKNYVDELLLSSEYASKFGQVPFLVGSFSKSNSINFFQNRLDFVSQCFANKYGHLPSFAQAYQGSNRMLNFWGNFEPDYWELPIGRGDDGTVDSPPRRDSLPVAAGAGQTGGGLVLDSNFSYNGPQSGHCAVDLIYHLSRETPFEGGFPYIAGTANFRDNAYKIVMYAFFLMRENSSELSEQELARLISLPFDQAFDQIISDYRYTSRFNLIWKYSTEVGPHWKKEPWFGLFMDKFYPWIYHLNLGWLYVPSGLQDYDAESKNGGFWAYSEELGWFWTYNIAFPWVFLNGEWVYLLVEDESIPTELYFSTARNSWVRF